MCAEITGPSRLSLPPCGSPQGSGRRSRSRAFTRRERRSVAKGSRSAAGRAPIRRTHWGGRREEWRTRNPQQEVAICTRNRGGVCEAEFQFWVFCLPDRFCCQEKFTSVFLVAGALNGPLNLRARRCAMNWRHSHCPGGKGHPETVGILFATRPL